MRSSIRSSLLLLLVMPATSGCVARAAIGIVTAPVKVVSKAADWATTSQDEEDRATGRALRQREERLGALERRRLRYARGCEGGDQVECSMLNQVEAQIDAELAGAQPHG